MGRSISSSVSWDVCMTDRSTDPRTHKRSQPFWHFHSRRCRLFFQFSTKATELYWHCVLVLFRQMYTQDAVAEFNLTIELQIHQVIAMRIKGYKYPLHLYLSCRFTGVASLGFEFKMLKSARSANLGDNLKNRRGISFSKWPCVPACAPVAGESARSPSCPTFIPCIFFFSYMVFWFINTNDANVDLH